MSLSDDEFRAAFARGAKRARDGRGPVPDGAKFLSESLRNGDKFVERLDKSSKRELADHMINECEKRPSLLEMAGANEYRLDPNDMGSFLLGPSINLLKRKSPEVYELFFKKIYKHVDKWHDWRWPSFLLSCYAAMFMDGTADHTVDVREMAIFLAQWTKEDMPIYFIEPDLLEACLQTNPPTDIDVSDLKLPHPGFIMMLPRGKFKEANEDIPYIAVARYEPDFFRRKHSIHGTTIDVTIEGDFDKLDEPEFTVATTREGTFHTTTMRTIASKIPELLKEDHIDIKWRTTDTDEVIAIANRTRILHVALNLILAMEARPTLIERGRKITQHKRDRKQEIWHPNIIGSKYQFKHVTGGVEKGSHSSPRFHWRRGHFRRQGIGPRLNKCTCGDLYDQHVRHDDAPDAFCKVTDCRCTNFTRADKKFDTYQTIWIEPMMVNFEIEKAT
jgi:hypothetical protein